MIRQVLLLPRGHCHASSQSTPPSCSLYAFWLALWYSTLICNSQSCILHIYIIIQPHFNFTYIHEVQAFFPLCSMCPWSSASSQVYLSIGVIKLFSWLTGHTWCQLQVPQSHKKVSTFEKALTFHFWITFLCMVKIYLKWAVHQSRMTASGTQE